MPGYQAPKCYVSKGEPNQIIEEFVKYLTEISKESFSLLHEQYAPVFEALKQTSVHNRDDTHEDHLAQTLVDLHDGDVQPDHSKVENEQEDESEEHSEDESRGIDLMASDDEEDREEIDSENEEDRAFLDDQLIDDNRSF